MALPITFNGEQFQGANVSVADGPPSASFTVGSTQTGSVLYRYQLFGTVSQPGDQINVPYAYSLDGGRTFFAASDTFVATQFDSARAIQFTSGNRTFLISNTPLVVGETVVFPDTTLGDFTPSPIVCFVTGTQIATARGEMPVEQLRSGDLAVTATGKLRPIVWIGSRDISAAIGSLPMSQRPMRIAAGAFGSGLPARNLYLSPGHPVLIGADDDGEGGALTPIMCLENGTSIRREARSSVTYWHVELDAHDVLLAEGLPAESYIDGGDRPFFIEASDHALHNPDFISPGWDARCRPLAVDGFMVEAERFRINALFAAGLERHSAWPCSSPLDAAASYVLEERPSQP